MLIQLLTVQNFVGRIERESNTLTKEDILEILKEKEISINEKLNLASSYKVGDLTQKGDFTDNTVINTGGIVTISLMLKMTEAASYTEEEVAEVIAKAKDAILISNQKYEALRDSCRNLAQISPEIRTIIGNYTHYPVSSLISAIERALNVLAPVAEVSEEQLTEVWNKINFLSAKVEKITNETSNGTALIEAVEAIGKVREDLAFVSNHLGLVLPNHPELYKG